MYTLVPMTRRPTFLLSAAVLLSLCSLASAQQVDAPSGWTFTQQGSNWIYKPAKPPAGATFLLTVAPPQALDGKNLEAWLKSHVESDAANRGTLEDKKVQNAMLGLRAIERSYRDSKRHHWLVTYLAFPLSENRVLYCYFETNLPESQAGEYIHAGGKICGETARNASKNSPLAK